MPTPNAENDRQKASRAARLTQLGPHGVPMRGYGDFAHRPGVLIQAALIVTGDKTAEGHLVEAVSVPWLEIIRHLERDPSFLHQVEWRKMEELIAGAYKRQGWPEVILTPRSGDGGRDIIASKPGVGAIRIIDQVKAFKAEHLVSANDVRAMLGVLDRDRNVSKGVITTTSGFAPGIHRELAAYMPYRLELKDGPALTEWLKGLSRPQPERIGRDGR